jgi:immune inhibitor A
MHNTERLLGQTTILLLSFFLIGCRGAAPLVEDVSTQVLPIPTQVLVETPTLPPTEPSPEFTLDPIPSRVMRDPVTEAAHQTAADLSAADRVPVDYYSLALEVRGMMIQDLEAELPSSDLELGDRTELIINYDLQGDYRPVSAIVRQLTPNAVWWLSEGVTLSDSQIAGAAQRFEEDVIPSNRAVFGQEWIPGIDNDPRVHILLVAPSTWRGFYGYFSMMNQYPRSLFPNSNQREMIVLNVETGEYGSSGEYISEIKRLDTSDFAGQLAHEYQHLIHWNVNHNQDNWLNEAMSELASFLMTSLDPKSTLGLTNMEYFAQNPHIQLTSRPDRSKIFDRQVIYGHYGGEKLLAVYLMEQFGIQFIRDLMNNPTPGVYGIQQAVDKRIEGRGFIDVFASWLVANLINQPALEQGQFGYQQITPFEPVQEDIKTFPIQTIAARLKPFGARYYRISADQPVEVSFSGSTMARLAPFDPPNGHYVWYSNRGDETVFSLWREFDLTGVESATLNYQVSYDLEKDYDYGYVQVSTDGGETWSILETEYGSDENPHNTALGVGYTGYSGSWLSESLDLSTYVGNHILLRFQVINDYTTNLFGLQIDDIEIPEIGFFDGVEDDTGNWYTQGFIRSSNFVPVEWIVWLVTNAETPKVTRIDIDSHQATEVIIKGLGSEFQSATLVVSPTAPVTSMELDYDIVFKYP